VTITCANLISPANASVSLGQVQTFAASLCVASGTPITWDVNGVTGGNSSIGTITSGSTGASGNAALYIAPADLPSTDPVTIHAAAGATIASATVTIRSTVVVSVSPASATVTVSQRVTLTAAVTNSPDTAVTWSVNGVPNGTPAVGEICVVGYNPCVSPNGAVSGSVDYVAPAAAPTVNPVTITAASKADSSRTGSATVFVEAQTGTISIAVSPTYAFVAPSGSQLSTTQFFAAVSGTNVGAVTWAVQSAASGQGCGGAACGSVDGNGLYRAPTIAPSPNAISVTATSAAGPTKSASATVAITSGPTILALLPSSVMAGAVESFPFEVNGANFVAGSGGSGSVILLNGAPRSTTCQTAGSCTTALNPPPMCSPRRQSRSRYGIPVRPARSPIQCPS
jgi:hypothetical protein